jgi:hypothetical protein
MTEDSPSESTTSPRENKKSRRKDFEDTSARGPSETPKSGDGED